MSSPKDAIATAHSLTAQDAAGRKSFPNIPTWETWRTRWHERLRRQPQDLKEAQALMRRSNPAFIPRNHKVEEALAAATTHGDLSLVEKLLKVLANPFTDDDSLPEYRTPPLPSACRYQTYCGT